VAFVTALPETSDKSRAVEAMFDRIAPRYDALNRVLTFRLDTRWRRITVDALGIPAGSRVLDLACGTGDLCRILSDRGHSVVGLDFSEGMLRAAHTTTPLVRADALQLPFAPGSFDAITCGFGLRNFTAIAPVLRECARVLRPRGRVGLLEVSEPEGAVLHALHNLYFRHIVPVVGGALSDKAAYRYLPESTAYLPSQPAMLAMLDDAGIVDVSLRTLGFGAASLVVGTRR
jgi:demethylmenaquinone methyltransferase/2-methoxy-6-polyprenyl-1,4-benzoquinol methylase